VRGVIQLRGERVLLRPFRLEEVDDVWAAREAEQGPWVGTRNAFARRLAQSGKFVGGRLDLAIEADGQLVGELDARHADRFVPPGVWELGIMLFGDARRGRGYGTEAVALLVDYLFREAGAGRVQATTAVGNEPMRRVLEKTGFTYEGTLRGFMPAGAGREDYALYAITRDDWPSIVGRRPPSAQLDPSPEEGGDPPFA
jgi:ribosomal-protein-alanine N-acetyltransferase